MHGEDGADVLSDLPYSYYNGVLTVIDKHVSSQISRRKIPLEIQHSISISVKDSRTIIRYGSASVYCALLCDVLSLPAIPLELFVKSAKREIEIPRRRAPQLCFSYPDPPPVSEISVDSTEIVTARLARSASGYRTQPSRPEFRISARPPAFFYESSNTLLKCYRPGSPRGESPKPRAARKAAPAVGTRKSAEAAPRPGPLHIEFKPAVKGSAARSSRPGNGEVRSADGRKVIIVRGLDVVLTGDQEVVAETRAGLFRILGLAPDWQVTAIVFQ
jgi:hypothetical protein